MPNSAKSSARRVSLTRSLVLPPILQGFLVSHPRISVEVVIDDSPVDVVEAGCDAGIRYGELLSNDMAAVPIGPAGQRLVTAASPRYLGAHGVPDHPRDLLEHACLRHRFPSGVMPPWMFERDEDVIKVDPTGPLVVSTLGADLKIDVALKGLGIVYLFEDWIARHLSDGDLALVLDAWCKPFDGPKLYFRKRAVLPRPYPRLADQRLGGRLGGPTRPIGISALACAFTCWIIIETTRSGALLSPSAISADLERRRRCHSIRPLNLRTSCLYR